MPLVNVQISFPIDTEKSKEKKRKEKKGKERKETVIENREKKRK